MHQELSPAFHRGSLQKPTLILLSEEQNARREHPASYGNFCSNENEKHENALVFSLLLAILYTFP